MFKFKLKPLTKKGQMQRKINTLENKVETLEGVIKSELYRTFMEKLSEPAELAKYKSENKKLRKKNKILKELLREDSKKKVRSKKNAKKKLKGIWLDGYIR